MNLKTIDLCAGIGGIRRGFELAGGYTNVAAAEIDEMACKTYEHIFHDNPRNDITDGKFKKRLQKLRYDVLLAGFPCQTFSSVGQRLGFKDKTKGTIFFDIAKIIEMTRPKAIFLENVQNLLSHDHTATFSTIVDTLDRQLNYQIIGVAHGADGKPKYGRSSFIRNSKDFGIPQNRPRVYIVAFSRDYFGKHLEILPNETPRQRSAPPIYESLADVLDSDVGSRFFLSSGYLDTLEKHIKKQHNRGYGFGYRIVNSAVCIYAVVLDLAHVYVLQRAALYGIYHYHLKSRVREKLKQDKVVVRRGFHYHDRPCSALQLNLVQLFLC